jgi:uncharacterized cofD-like protein
MDEPNHNGKLKITHLKTKPQAKINSPAKQAILKADLIILGPGDFYTNTIANLVINGVKKALQASNSQLMFIANLMTKYGETYNYKLSNFFKDLDSYLPLDEIDYVLINNNTNYPTQVLKLYQQEEAKPVKDDLTKKDINQKVKIIRTDLLSKKIPKKEKGDLLTRSMIRHDPDKLAKEIMKLIWQN